ncbi:K+-transporting ATPase ATPase A chain [Antricoccus suffuscus]|uniref:Potassium-transporting ATPase potassium-binding subunit n=1 Tax=Antricoccus suffuscus TaxID=1629062 RepID=A0A2T0ZC37_9ACTN|nr:potassium-transporting ATPase subunit KdpA [Antricoccus suffuscus]PRZ33903.1 K+-transporting ATPase ATPase A chain [Antricoccus suffuscus]
MTGDWRYGAIQLAILVVAIAVVQRPLGNYLARVYSSERHLRVEKWIYRAIGVNPDADQRWPAYLRGVLVFSGASVIVLFVILRAQAWLPLSLGHPGMPAAQAFNTSASFVTNTNWQSYAGEQSLGDVAQMAGLGVQNFVSAAVGMAVAVAVVRGLIRTKTGRIGNFWSDLVRGVVRGLLPLAFVAAVVLLAGGVIQNFSSAVHAAGVAGTGQNLPMGPVASQEAIKLLGTNGGGFFNANSAHPFENPTWWTNLFEIFLLLVIPFSMPRAFGRMIGSVKQGRAILFAMTVLALGSTVITFVSELMHGGTALQAAGAAMEGKEVRFGVTPSALFSSATTLTSTGAVDSMHSSYTPFGGGTLIANMAVGEVAPGGVGSGLYGMLVLAIVAVFVAGLMVGRTPEFIGKKIGAREMKLISLYILVTPALALVGTGIAIAINAGRASILNPGAHGLSEVLYAFTSAANNNGSAFAGLNANTNFYNIALGTVMILGRFLPIVMIVALAGSFAHQTITPSTAGTLRTYGALFVAFLVVIAIAVAALTYFPALALGPLTEGIA